MLNISKNRLEKEVRDDQEVGQAGFDQTEIGRRAYEKEIVRGQEEDDKEETLTR